MPSPIGRSTENKSHTETISPDPGSESLSGFQDGKGQLRHRTRTFLETVSFRTNQGVEIGVVTCGIAMTLIVAVQVFCRYVLNHSLFWSEELARYLLVWLTFLGASVAYRRQAHPGIDLFVSRLPGELRRYTAIGVHLVTLGLSGVMIVSGAQFAWFVRLQITPALSLPKWIILSIIPLAGLLFLIHGMFFLIRTLEGDQHGQ